LTEHSQLFGVVTIEYNLMHTFHITYVIHLVNRHLYICAAAGRREIWRAYR